MSTKQNAADGEHGDTTNFTLRSFHSFIGQHEFKDRDVTARSTEDGVALEIELDESATLELDVYQEAAEEIARLAERDDE